MGQYEYFKVERSDGILTITMNLPPLNVLNIPMMAEFNTLLEPVVGDEGLSAWRGGHRREHGRTHDRLAC